MRVIAFLLILGSKAVSAFQQHGMLSQTTRGIQSNLDSHSIEGTDADGMVASSEGFSLPQADASSLSRQAFLAKLLVASSLPTILDNAPAFAAEIPGPPPGVAIYAYRSGGLPTLRALGLSKLLTRYEGYLEGPKSKNGQALRVAFDFPTDWLQLDRGAGGVQYVDQRNGNKLYVLHATLPEGATLKAANKQWFADAILSPEGDLARSGVVAEGGRISRSQMISDCSAEDAPSPCMDRRRMVLKYDTVTGNGVQTVERRGLIEAYQVGNDVYIMLATVSAVQFEKKGSKERDTVDAIADSFKIGDAALALS